ncbi:Acetyltransferase domain containing protein [Pyrenophora tritici-repentis]|uniref:Acetyltransferase domain containing protein n=2 Tax=Pyrenophora tritici-repentis TaxID=45151 RepID=A0A922T079_9PLEO|nr:acetyltransferase [Pyrenophora tritici-repentis Pt-1C-BFP]EDU48381.1 acetyltransferase [Pyrenophora tritici-repentis Pt-1C-BFP]KAI1514108.1 Acetyltransferase domain containing protein [Pyrenophora tritici-repentis]KAI1666681.1 Acetyltransferase domain containing protein [Pyrenophora tritici-repentis]KAI1682514.1 Acetyltransferase domain containing protein [Pyrenophora tritici-repentis]
MPIQVTRMAEADIDGAVTTIQEAFADDPYKHWAFPDPSKFSPVRNRLSLSMRCRWGIKHGLFHVARDTLDPTKILGCAMWMPPHPTSEPESWSLYLSYWYIWLNQIRMNLWHGRGGLSKTRYWIWKARQAEAQKELWTDPNGYYFCNIVTVLPEAQGKGVGKALINEVLDMADKEGRRSYLEASRLEPNVAIYERFGFKLVREMECRDGDGEKDSLTLYCMMREPKGVQSGETSGEGNSSAEETAGK